jgi:hypothetical protein
VRQGFGPDGDFDITFGTLRIQNSAGPARKLLLSGIPPKDVADNLGVSIPTLSDLLKVGPETWEQYGARGQTRREHLVELQDVYGYQVFTLEHRQQAIDRLVEVAWLTDKGVVLAETLVADLRARKILLPPVGVCESIPMACDIGFR